jgi:hypothetical protein
VSPRRIVVVAVVAGVVVGVTAVAYALEVQITTVRVVDRGRSDAQLDALRPRLRRLVGYRSFQVVRVERRQCAWQTTEAFKIPGGRILHVVPKRMQEQTVAMQVKLIDRRRPLVDTDFRLQNRGVLLFAVDRDVHGAEPLIIVLKAEE